jgi:hypothetical protein
MEQQFDMMIDGKKVTVTEKTLKARTMRNKKVEVEVNGRIIRVPENMLHDLERFGVSQSKRVIKNPPKELLNMPDPKTLIRPATLKTVLPPEKKEIVPEVQKEVPDVVPEVKKERKKPVRSKSK